MGKINYQKLHAFIDKECSKIEAEGDWVKRVSLTAYQENKLKALKGNTSCLSLAEGISYGIGSYIHFHADEFIIGSE